MAAAFPETIPEEDEEILLAPPRIVTEHWCRVHGPINIHQLRRSYKIEVSSISYYESGIVQW